MGESQNTVCLYSKIEGNESPFGRCRVIRGNARSTRYIRWPNRADFNVASAGRCRPARLRIMALMRSGLGNTDDRRDPRLLAHGDGGARGRAPVDLKAVTRSDPPRFGNQVLISMISGISPANASLLELSTRPLDKRSAIFAARDVAGMVTRELLAPGHNTALGGELFLQIQRSGIQVALASLRTPAPLSTRVPAPPGCARCSARPPHSMPTPGYSSALPARARHRRCRRPWILKHDFSYQSSDKPGNHPGTTVKVRGRTTRQVSPRWCPVGPPPHKTTTRRRLSCASTPHGVKGRFLHRDGVKCRGLGGCPPCTSAVEAPPVSAWCLHNGAGRPVLPRPEGPAHHARSCACCGRRQRATIRRMVSALPPTKTTTSPLAGHAHAQHHRRPAAPAGQDGAAVQPHRARAAAIHLQLCAAIPFNVPAFTPMKSTRRAGAPPRGGLVQQGGTVPGHAARGRLCGAGAHDPHRPRHAPGLTDGQAALCCRWWRCMTGGRWVVTDNYVKMTRSTWPWPRTAVMRHAAAQRLWRAPGRPNRLERRGRRAIMIVPDRSAGPVPRQYLGVYDDPLSYQQQIRRHRGWRWLWLRSVMMRSTTPTPVSGSVHWAGSFRSSVPSFFGPHAPSAR